MDNNLVVGHCSQLTDKKSIITEIKYNTFEFIQTTHVLDKIINDIDEFRNEYSNTAPTQSQIDKLAEIIHELVTILKYK